MTNGKTPLSMARSGVLAGMDTLDNFFASGASMMNNILGTFGLPQFIPVPKKTGQLPSETPLTFSLPSPQEIMSPVGKVMGKIGAASVQDKTLEKF